MVRTHSGTSPYTRSKKANASSTNTPLFDSRSRQEQRLKPEMPRYLNLTLRSSEPDLHREKCPRYRLRSCLPHKDVVELFLSAPRFTRCLYSLCEDTQTGVGRWSRAL